MLSLSVGRGTVEIITEIVDGIPCPLYMIKKRLGHRSGFPLVEILASK